MKRKMLRSAVAFSICATTAAAWAVDDRPLTSGSPAASADDSRGRAAPAAPVTRETSPARNEDGSRTLGTTIDDATITAKVKTALATDELTDALDINVDTMRSVVTLHGTVGSQAEAARAAEIAQRTEGVTAVRNELRVAR